MLVLYCLVLSGFFTFGFCFFYVEGLRRLVYKFFFV